MENILHINGKGCLLDIDARQMSSDDYGTLFDAFHAQHAPRREKWDHADLRTLYPDRVAEGLPFHEELAGPDGVSIELYAFPGVTHEQVEAAKRKLRNDRDVVRFHLVRINEWVEFKPERMAAAKKGTQ